MRTAAGLSLLFGCLLLAPQALAGHGAKGGHGSSAGTAHPAAVKPVVHAAGPMTAPVVVPTPVVLPRPPVVVVTPDEAGSDAPAAPPPAPPAAQDGMIDVTFESGQDHVSLQAQKGAGFDKVCEAPCDARLAAGTVLALRHDGNTTLAEGEKPVVLTESARVIGTYVDRSRTRIAGAALLAVSFIGGVAMVLDSGMSPGCFNADDGGDGGCYGTTSHPRPVEGLAGYTIALVGSTAGILMLARPNLARFDITPLSTASPLAGAADRPEAARLQRGAAHAEGIGLRVTF